MTATNLENKCINMLRFLAADMVQNANSGHPGLPMGAAAMAFTLWNRYLKFNPANPKWVDRDRFILSAGHGSSLLYSLLHLTGYALTLDDLKQFRQWGSLTPGHPETGQTPGVEATTGPLGQGFSSAVGMAIAEAHLAARYNKPGHTIVDHSTFVLAGDGDMMEGITNEAASLAGHLRLNKLTVLYDCNHVSLSGSTALTFTEDIAGRFTALGWQVQTLPDGNDVEAISAALQNAKGETGKPSLIIVHTHIGYGSPKKQDSYESHGAPLGKDELRAAKEKLGWPAEPSFFLPDDALAVYRKSIEQGKEAEAAWQAKFDAYAKTFPDLAREFSRRMRGEYPEGWDSKFPAYPPDAKGLPTRKAAEAVLQILAAEMPEFIGGSADLNPSAYTWMKGFGDFENAALPKDRVEGACGGAWGYEGRNIHFGVREHAMGAIVNGLAWHGGFLPFGTTFLVFVDYMRAAIRVSAFSHLHTIWYFSHDSIAIGEDGPTHQPVEQITSLRMIPFLHVIRPADVNEMVEAWRAAVRRKDGPTVILATRQNAPVLDRTNLAPASDLQKGAYILKDAPNAKPDMLLLASGTEVALALAAAEKLATEGIAARVVSFPSWELFAEQDATYRESVLPKKVTARLAVEAGISLGWEKWVGERGGVLSVERFGASAPTSVMLEKFGYTVENVVAQAKTVYQKRGA